MGHQRLGRKIDRGCAYAANQDAIVAEDPLHDVVVIAGSQRRPERDFLTTADTGVVFPGEAAVADFPADVSRVAQLRSSGAGGAVRIAHRDQVEVKLVTSK